MPEKRKADKIVALFAKQGKARNISAIARLMELSRTQVYRVLRAAKLVAPAKKVSKKK